MEDQKNYPPLPSNYVTLAQLQERWLKEKEKEKEIKQQPKQLLEQEQDPDPKLHQHNLHQDQQRQPKTQQQAWRVFQRRRTEFGSATGSRHPKKFRSRNRNISESNRLAIEVSCDKHENLETKVDIGDENIGQDGKRKKSKKKQKPRAAKEERGMAEDAGQATVEGDKEVKNSDVKRVDDKTEVKSELNDKRSNLMTEVAEKLGILSINSGSDKQNVRSRRPYNSFDCSHRNHGGRSYNNRPYGGRFHSQQVQRARGDKMIWVRKNENIDGNVGGIQIAKGSLLER